jgi:hypothetical protein
LYKLISSKNDYEKMLVKVKVKATGNTQVITKKAYDFAKRLYVYLGEAPKDSDLAEYQPAQQVTTTTTTQPVTVTLSSPNQQTTANNSQPGEEKSAEVVVINQAQKKRGPKPKNQISSATAAAEV